jgi:Isochorismatase family
MVRCRGNQEIGYLMSKQAVSNVSYPVAPGTTALLSIDCQFGFGAGSWEQVPNADAAVENLRLASRAWRECGGAVVHVQTVYTPERGPSGRITDFEPGIADALAEGTRAAEAYPDLVLDGDRPDPDDKPARPTRSDPVLPAQSEDETGIGWGEAPEPDDDERLRRDRPPHWDQ